MSENNPPDPPERLINFFSPEEHNIYESQLAILASGRPVGLDGISSLMIKPPGPQEQQ